MSISPLSKRMSRFSVIILCSVVALVGFGVVGSANTDLNQLFSAGSAMSPEVNLSVTSTADVAANFGACGNSAQTTSSGSLREAICAANNAGATASTITMAAGTYILTNGELQMGKVSGSNITLNGAGAASTIISGNNASRVFDLDVNIVGGVTTTISGVTITGGADNTFGGAGIIAGSGHALPLDSLTVNNCTITGNSVNTTASNKPGGGIGVQGGNLIITNSTISNNSSGSSPGGGVSYTSEGATAGEVMSISGTTFSANHVTATVANVNMGGGGLETANSSSATSTFTVTNSRFINNTVVATGTAIAHGGAIFSQTGPLNVTGSTFTGNSVTGGAGQYGGAMSVTGNAPSMHYNRITGNIATNGSGVAVPYVNGATVNATQNWWGCNAGPGNAGCDSVFGATTFTPWLVLAATASPSTIVGPNATSTITASLTTDSNGGAVSASNLGAFAGLPVAWSDPLPSGATVGPAFSNISSGVASATFNSQNSSGPGHVLATLDNGTATATLTVNRTPAITSANAVTFSLSTAGSFTITTTGYPTAAITKTGTLPAGLTFTANANGTATLSGTPTASGTFPLSITASNGVLPNATQTLTITVDRPDTTVSSVNRVTATPTNASSVQWTVTFANALSGLTASNLTLTQTAGACTSPALGTITPVGGSPAAAWTVNASTGTGDCTLRLDVANDTGLSYDVTNLPFTSGNTIAIDKTAPSTTSFVRQTPATSPTNAETLVFRSTFSEAVTGVDAADFTVSGTTATVTSVTGVGAGPTFTQYDIAVSGGDLASLNGTVGLAFNAGAPANFITDAAGNNLPKTAPATNQTYVVDNQVPTVTVAPAASQGNPTLTGPINFTATFNEAVTGFDQSDILVTGTATYSGGSPVVTVTNPSSDGKTYNIAVSGMVTSGTVIVQVKSGAAQDQALNTNASSNVSTAVQYQASARHPRADFDGDGRTDVSVFRPSDGTWYQNNSTTGFSATHWGQNGDVIVPGDFDGDGETDFGIWRPSAADNVSDFYVLNSSGFTITGVDWGLPGDIPISGDYDGDGKTDFTVYRPSDSYWWIYNGQTHSFAAFQFGASGDVPMAMDSNGDGKTDLAVYRPSNHTWYMANASGTPSQTFTALTFGATGDVPVPADYDGDSKDDVAVFRPSNGTWYIFRSSDSGVTTTQFGLGSDIPVPGDYDGDGKYDIAVYRPSSGTWYINRSTTGFAANVFGVSTDTPVPAAYHP